MYSLYFDFSEKLNKIVILKKAGQQIDEFIFSDDNTVGAVDKVLKRNNLSIDNIDSADFKEDGSSFTGARISSAITNVINLSKGKLQNYNDIKLPKYSSEPNLTWSSKNINPSYYI